MQVKLKEIPKMLLLAYVAEAQNLWMWGKPGIGKTDTVEEFAAKMRERVEDFMLWYFYGPTMSPIDIQGTMMAANSDVMKVCNNETLPNAYTHPNARGAIFFGEAGNTDNATLKQLQKYINGEDMNGKLRKPKGVMVIADSNRLQDKAGVIQQFRALMNRFIQVDVYTEPEDNIEYADRKGWHPTVQHFFKYHPDMIDNYNEIFEGEIIGGKKKSDKEIALASEEGKRGVWACMRGWKRIHHIEYACEELKSELPTPVILGSVGTGVGQHYLANRNAMVRLLSVDQICADPKNAKIPASVSEMFGQCLVLALRCTEKQFPAVHAYGARLPYDMQALILRRAVKRPQFNIINTKTYITWMSDPQLSDLLIAK